MMELTAEEFLRRFLLHVVPTGFVRIRHYGLLANRTRQAKLARARQLLAVVAATPLLSPVSLPAHGHGSFPRRCHSLPPLCWHALADHRSPHAPARTPAMTGRHARSHAAALAHSPLLVTSLASGLVLVCPPPGSPFCSLALSGTLPPPAFSCACRRLLLCLLATALSPAVSPLAERPQTR